MSSNAPNQILTIYLIKDSVKKFDECLESESGLTQYELNTELEIDGVVYLAKQKKNSPRWANFLETGMQGSIGNLLNTSTSAVLFIRKSKRIFAFTFGYGGALIKKGMIERYFGMKVVLNTVTLNKINSIDSKAVQEKTIYSRKQISETSELAEFGIDKEEDLLGHVSGVPEGKKLANSASGSDALHISLPIHFRDLGKKCGEILKAYKSDRYRKVGFEFVDHLKNITDPSLVEQLDNLVISKIKTGNHTQIHMAPPGIVDWDEVEGFSFIRSADPEPVMNLDDFSTQAKNISNLDRDKIRSRRVFVHRVASQMPIPEWRLYDVLVTEEKIKKKVYVLSGGDWYNIDDGFVKTINNRMSKIKNSSISLPNAKEGMSEGEYNAIVGTKAGVYCLDGKFARSSGDPIEFCDLYTSKKEIVHVKWWKASSTLSHLFSQSRISAEEFLYDPKFRDEIRDIIRDHSVSAAKRITVSQPKSSDFTVVLAIIKGGKGWKKDLPFFSRLNLVRAAAEIRRLGFEVRVAKIEVDAT